MTREKMLGAWKARYKWCFSQTMQMLVRSLRKLTYLVCVQWKEFLTGHSNQDNCAVSKYSGMHTVSKYLYIFFILMFCFVCLQELCNYWQTFLVKHVLMQLFILKIIDLFLVSNFSDKFHNIYHKPDEIKWKSNPFNKKIWQKW